MTDILVQPLYDRNKETRTLSVFNGQIIDLLEKCIEMYDDASILYTKYLSPNGALYCTDKHENLLM